MTKKILIATGVYPPESGGPATYTKLLEERLPALGFAVSVLPFSRVRHLPKIVRHLAYFFICLWMARCADIVYALDTVSVGFPAALAATVLGKKFVVRVPGDYAWEQARQRFGVEDELDSFQHRSYGLRVGILRAIQKFVLRRAQVVVVPSKYMHRIVKEWGVKNIHIIYSSIENPSYNPVDRPEGFLIVSSGRDVPWKGFHGLKEVAKNNDWTLYIAENLSRADALGWVKVADVYVLNSTYEGLSHALIEAMMLGTPVIATNVGGNTELVEEGRGLLVKAKDENELTQAIRNVELHPEEAKMRAAKAKEFVERECSIGLSVKKLAGILQTL